MSSNIDKSDESNFPSFKYVTNFIQEHTNYVADPLYFWIGGSRASKRILPPLLIASLIILPSLPITFVKILQDELGWSY